MNKNTRYFVAFESTNNSKFPNNAAIHVLLAKRKETKNNVLNIINNFTKILRMANEKLKYYLPL